MSKPKFTKGPWFYDGKRMIKSLNRGKVHNCIAAIGACQFEFEGKTHESLTAPAQIDEANAVLMAAAPELYGALENAVKTAAFDIPEDLIMARAVLKKARGE